MKLRKLKRHKDKNRHGINAKQKHAKFETLRDLSFQHHKAGKTDEEIACYKKMLTLSPGNSDVLNNLGTTLKGKGLLGESINCFKKALKQQANDPGTYNNLANALCMQGNVDEAISYLSTGLARFEGVEESKIRSATSLAAVHSSMLLMMNYSSSFSQKDIFMQSSRWWNLYGKQQSFKFSHTAQANKKLRIGYLSNDFCRHSVSSFFLPLIKGHDRENFKIYCYSDVMFADEITDRIRQEADHWRPIVWEKDDAVASQIVKDKIDILVDLGGHTGKNRLMVFAMAPAPTQVSYLGYPNTTGVKSIGYRFTDEIADPPGAADQYYSESLIRLPKGFLCYRPLENIPVQHPQNRTPKNHFTFASFNNISKLETAWIEVWAQILHQVPNAILMLKSKSLADPITTKRLLHLFKDFGIAKDRLQLLPWVPNTTNHLQIYEQVDVALDTFPYNGTTTTCEAIWMNVPVVSLCGNRHAERVGASILTRVGLQELICLNKQAYIDTAVALAQSTNFLEKITDNLHERFINSALGNIPQFTAQLEESYKTIHKNLTKQV